MENKFNFNIGVSIDEEIFKSATESSGDNRYKNMIIEGLASDSSKDQQGDILEPSGYEIDGFLKSGMLNLEHFTSRKGDPSYWIGEPIEAKVKDNKFFIKGKLWEKHPLARKFWDQLLIMKASGSTRAAGFSIEGTAKEKDPKNKKRITKAKINHCAVTFSPVNANSWLEIVKSIQSEGNVDIGENIQPYIYEFEKSGNIITVHKDFSVTAIPTNKTVLLDGLRNGLIKYNEIQNILDKI